MINKTIPLLFNGPYLHIPSIATFTLKILSFILLSINIYVYEGWIGDITILTTTNISWYCSITKSRYRDAAINQLKLKVDVVHILKFYRVTSRWYQLQVQWTIYVCNWDILILVDIETFDNELIFVGGGRDVPSFLSN